MCVCVWCAHVCVCVWRGAQRAALGVTGLVFVHILLFTAYVQITGNPLSCHVFLCTRKYGFLVMKHIY